VSHAERIVFFVRNDAHAPPADLQPEHERGYGVASLMVGRAFVLASQSLHCTSCGIVRLAYQIKGKAEVSE
jgi:hypothetical protein